MLNNVLFFNWLVRGVVCDNEFVSKWFMRKMISNKCLLMVKCILKKV